MILETEDQDVKKENEKEENCLWNDGMDHQVQTVFPCSRQELTRIQGNKVPPGDALHLLPINEMKKWRKNVLLVYFDILD